MKKKISGTADARHEFRCTREELEKFREAAFREGFGGNVSAWILWHLRRASGLVKPEHDEAGPKDN